MKKKLLIIVGVIVAGIILFPQAIDILKEKAAEIGGPAADEFGQIKNNGIDTVSQGVENTASQMTENMNGLKTPSDNSVEEDLENNKVSQASPSTNETPQYVPVISELSEGITGLLDQIESSGPPDGTEDLATDDGIVGQQSQTEGIQGTLLEGLTLTIKKTSDDMIIVHYLDTTGMTSSVDITLRNSERDLFSGIYYSSEFEAVVKDITETPSYVDLVIEHQKYGTITSSAHNPAGTKDTVINGVFFDSGP